MDIRTGILSLLDQAITSPSTVMFLSHSKLEIADEYTGNHVYYTSGRSPALSGNTLFHSINSVWSENSGHLIEGGDQGKGLYEGNYFYNCPVVAISDYGGLLFSSPASDLSVCSQYLGRDCVENLSYNSEDFEWDDSSFLYLFEGYDIPTAEDASSTWQSVVAAAGNTL